MIFDDNPEYTMVQMTVNGEVVSQRIPTYLRLLDFLRVELRLTGSKEVCGEGECGACSIIMDGKLINSCLIFAVEAEGSQIVTIEGISEGESLSDLQQGFIDHHSVQCGYCIPGMIMAGTDFLEQHNNPSREEIAGEMAGNLCRCTGYKKIIDAVEHSGNRH